MPMACSDVAILFPRLPAIAAPGASCPGLGTHDNAQQSLSSIAMPPLNAKLFCCCYATPWGSTILLFIMSSITFHSITLHSAAFYSIALYSITMATNQLAILQTQ